MAWTKDKVDLFASILIERIGAEQSVARDWVITQTWINVFEKHIPPDIFQKMLNDFIDEKIVYMDNKISQATLDAGELEREKTNLLNNKEDSLWG